MKFVKLFLFIFFGFHLNAQNIINAEKIEGQIKIDGILDEAVWQTATSVSDFIQNFPYDTSKAVQQTHVKICYNDQYLFIAAECVTNNSGKYVISSLRRDFIGISDVFEVYIDPFGDKTNGFLFGVNPLGVQREGMISYGSDVNYGWDNIWLSHTTEMNDRWIVEIAIPFKTLRFKKGEDNWLINFARVDLKANERSSWISIPRNFSFPALAFAGNLKFAKQLKSAGANITVIPYAAGQSNIDYVANTSSPFKPNAGLDAKVAVTSALNLDITFNPDFAQVEVDKQVTNLSRFEIYFPERRQFFIENSDIFARFGAEEIAPFFSRRIGVGVNPYTGLYKQAPILYGLRLSGRLNNNWRIGLMNLQTVSDKSINLPGNNYISAAVQRKIFHRSNIGLIFVNKQSVTNDSTYKFDLKTNKFNRVLGLDYNVASKNNKWSGKFFYHQAFSPLNTPDQKAYSGYLSYSASGFFMDLNQQYLGLNYDPEVGYVPRNNCFRVEPDIGWKFYPKKNKIINNQGPYLGGDIFKSLDFSKTLDGDIDAGYNISLQNTSSLRVFYRYDYVYLYFPFDPTNTNGLEYETGTAFSFNSVRIRYNTDIRKKLNLNFYLKAGQYYTGTIGSITGSLNYRIQPYGILSLDFAFNQINLPKPYSSANLILLGPRIDFAFSKKVFLITTFQYNNQINNFNTNIRFQYRFKPCSDFYIVYTDNYYSKDFTAKDRAIVLKFTYWLNL